jgi:hypothetical protein
VGLRIDLLMDSVWSQVWGCAILGPLRGTILAVLPASITPWKAWREEHPATLALDEDGPRVFRERPTDRFVIGVALAGHARGFHFAEVRRLGVVNDALGPHPVVVHVTDDGMEVPAVTAAQMREVDRIAIEETGPTLLQMMEHAGRSLALEVLRRLGGAWRTARVVVLAGTGGNGGGGICAARHLANHGVDASGETPGEFLRATWTLTLALPKTGLASRWSGEIVLANLGIPAAVFQRAGIAIQGLSVALLIDAQDDGMGWGEIQAENDRCLGFEVGVGAGNVVVQLMGFEPMTSPEPADEALRNAMPLGYGPARPASTRTPAVMRAHCASLTPCQQDPDGTRAVVSAMVEMDGA